MADDTTSAHGDAAPTLMIDLNGDEVDDLLTILATWEVAAHDHRCAHPDDAELADRFDRQDALVVRLHQAIDAGVRPPVLLGLPERDVLRLPRSRVVVCGPGVATATMTHDAVVAAGRGEAQAWETAARESARELSAAVLAGIRGQTTRPLARLHRALLREAAAWAEG